jgi:hypothetical protein
MLINGPELPLNSGMTSATIYAERKVLQSHASVNLFGCRFFFVGVTFTRLVFVFGYR